MLSDFEDVFAFSEGELGTTNVAKHSVDTGDSAPLKQPSRRVPYSMRGKVVELVNTMLERGIIEPSSSPWASPIVLVSKRDGSTRFCVDYRRLNAVTKTDVFPLPRIDACLDSLEGNQFFSTLDLMAGYWQVGMEPTSKEKTSFVTITECYQFNSFTDGVKIN